MSGTAQRRHSLEGLVAPDWFAPAYDEQPEARLLAEVIGERFLAFAWLAGVRFTGLLVDEQVPHASEVEIAVGAGEEATRARMSVAELQRRLAAALVSDEPPSPSLPEAPTEADLQAAVGGTWLLLGPLFGLVPRALLVEEDGALRLEVQRDGDRLDLPLDAYRQVVRQLVVEELARAERERTVELDVALVDRAEEAAAAQRWSEVVRVLGSWPRHALFLMRAGELAGMKEAPRRRVAQGLGLLGTALSKLGERERAEEALRVGLQWASLAGREASAELFLRHGASLLDQGRHGEAIAPLRRALSLGAERAEVLPLLAEAFVERGRLVAALGALRAAEEAGAEGERVDRLRGWISERLGEPAERWRREVAAEP